MALDVYLAIVRKYSKVKRRKILNIAVAMALAVPAMCMVACYALVRLLTANRHCHCYTPAIIITTTNCSTTNCPHHQPSSPPTVTITNHPQQSSPPSTQH
jgi:hypothetical protein